MRTLLSSRDLRTLLAGAGVIGALLLVSRGIPAWRRWDADSRAGAAEMTAALARAEADQRTLKALGDSAEARRERLVEAAPLVVDGNTPAAASATLASLVSGAAATAGVSVGAADLAQGDSASRGYFYPVSVRGDATGDLPGILRFLALLEGAPELLVVREAAITQPDAGGPADRPETLRLEFTVEGLALTPRGGSAR